MSPPSSLPALVTLSAIERAMKDSTTFQSDLLRGLKDGFVAYESGGFSAAPIQTLGAPPLRPFRETDGYAAQTCVKSGYFSGEPHYVIKVASGGRPFDNSGLLQVYSQSTGKLLALLLDDGVLTEIRTAAVGTLMTQTVFGEPKPKTVGMVGTGIQARYQLRFLSSTIGGSVSLYLYGRSGAKVDELKEDLMRELPASWTGDITVVDGADELLKFCDMIITTTCAREPVLGSSMPQSIRTKLICCIGADSPGKQELSGELIASANLLVADSLTQTQERGEFQRYCNEKGGTGDIVALGKLLADGFDTSTLGGLVIFDSSGVALQDCVIAKMVYNVVSNE